MSASQPKKSRMGFWRTTRRGPSGRQESKGAWAPVWGTSGGGRGARELEIGFQQVSELIHVRGVTFVGAIPSELQPGFSFAGAIPAAAQQPDAARALLRFLASPEAASTILKAGLTPP